METKEKQDFVCKAHTCKLAHESFVHGKIFTSSHPRKQARFLHYALHLSAATYLLEPVWE